MSKIKSKKGTLLAALAVLIMLVGVSLYAIHNLGLFELDGNVAEEAGGGDDWATLNPPTDTAGGSTDRLFVHDGSGTSIFTTGGSKDASNIPDWRWTDGNVPDKDDIINAMAAAYQVPMDLDPSDPNYARRGHLVMYFGVDRYAQNGDSQVGFWFLQDDVGPVNGGTFSGTHILGDILLLSDFTNGGTLSNVRALRWVGTGGTAKSDPDKSNSQVIPQFNDIEGGTDCRTSIDNDDLCARVNDAVIDVPWTYSPKSGVAQTYPQLAFYEGGIDLTALGVTGCFGGFIAETRSSQSIDAVLKDFAGGNLDTCMVEVSKTGDTVSKRTDPAHYTVTITNSGASPLYVDDIHDSLLGDIALNGAFLSSGFLNSGVITSNDCDNNVVPNSNPARYILMPTLSCEIKYTITVPENAGEPFTNTVTVHFKGQLDLSGVDVVGEASYTTNLFQPSVTIEKTVSPNPAAIDENATYHYVISNTSSSDSPALILDSISDDKLGSLAAAATTAGCDSLAPGGECEFDVVHKVVEANFPSVTNIVTVHYHPNNFPNDITANDSVTLNVRVNTTTRTEIHNGTNHTDVQNGSIDLGSTIHDKAFVGTQVGSTLITGTVTYKFFTTVDCTGDSTSETVAVGAESSNHGPLGAGDYSFQATYNGDDHYNSSSDGCEKVHVNKGQLSVTTIVHDGGHNVIADNGTVPLGSLMHDTATLSGVVAGFTAPTPTFTLTDPYTDNCSAGATVATDGTEGNATRSVATAALHAGKYAFKANVGGNDNYLADADGSPCEPFEVVKKDLTLTSQLHQADHSPLADGGAVALGSSIHDQGTVAGLVSGFALNNNVTFIWYSGLTGAAQEDCTVGTSHGGGAHSIDQATGLAHPSDPTGMLPAGFYAFRASLAGDSNYTVNGGASGNSACEPFKVNKADTSTATNIHDETTHNVVTVVELGSTVHDQASVTSLNNSFTIGGTVDFIWFTNSACTDGSTPAGTNVAVVAGEGHPSDSKGPLHAGSYAFKAHFDGDSNYNPSDGPCEPLTVNQADTSTVTVIHKNGDEATNYDLNVNPGAPALDLGSSVHDKGTVSSLNNAFTIDGALTYKFYSNSTCADGSSDEGKLVGQESSSHGPLHAGDYSFIAVYGGNSDYKTSTGACERLHINKAQLTVNTVVHNSGDSPITNGSVALGSVVHDTATVSGNFPGFVFPDPAFTLTTGYTGTCDAGAGVANNGLEGSAYRSANSLALHAGSYAYRAAVDGNDDYIGDTDECEPFTVNKGTLSILTTLLFTPPLNLGDTAQDSATVSGIVNGFNPTNSVVFTFFDHVTNNTTCAGNANAGGGGGSVTFASPTVNSGVQGPLAAGDYAFNASIAGDDDYNPANAVSECEPFHVNKKDLTLTTQLHKADESALADGGAVDLGSIIHDQATVSGLVSGFALNNSVTFNWYSGLTGATQEVCTDGALHSGGSHSIDQTTGLAHPSSATGALGAGFYAFRATLTGDSNYTINGGASGNSACEPFQVNKAQLAISTAVHDASHADVTGGQLVAPVIVHDTATVTGGVSGFPLPAVSFTLTSGFVSTCASGTNVALGGAEAPFTARTVDSGSLGGDSYAYRAVVADNANYIGATGVCEPFAVVVRMPITKTSTNPATPAEDGAFSFGLFPVPGGAFTNPPPNYPAAFATVTAPDNLFVPFFPFYATICEIGHPALWTFSNFTATVTGGSGSGASAPYHPTGEVDPQVYCIDLTVNPGATLVELKAYDNPPAGEVCSPGYWRQEQHFGSYPAGVTPNTLFGSIFTTNGVTVGGPDPLQGTSFASLTLLEALSLQGGGFNALARQAAGAYLNSLTIDFPMDTATVLSMVNGAFANNNSNYNGILTQLQLYQMQEASGVAVCPLN